MVYKVIHTLGENKYRLYVYVGNVPSKIKTELLSIQSTPRKTVKSKILEDYYGIEWKDMLYVSTNVHGGSVSEDDDDDITFDIENLENLVNESDVTDVRSVNKLKEKLDSISEMDIKLNKPHAPDTKIDEKMFKNYIFDMVIYDDDSLYKIKQKIALTIPSYNGKRIVPKYQYLHTDKTLGFNIKVGNNPLSVPAIPDSNIYSYETSRNDDISNLSSSLSYAKRYNIHMEYLDTSYHLINNLTSSRELYLFDLVSHIGDKNKLDSNGVDLVYTNCIYVYYHGVSNAEFNNVLKGNIPDYDKLINTIKNDIILEHNVVSILEEHKKNSNVNFNTSIIQAHVKLELKPLVNMFHMFVHISTTDDMPFMSIYTPSHHLSKILKGNIKALDTLSSFESVHHGLYFNIKVNNDWIMLRISMSFELQFYIHGDMVGIDDSELVTKAYEKIASFINGLKMFETIDPRKFKFTTINANTTFDIRGITLDEIYNKIESYFPYFSVSKKGLTNLRYKRIDNFDNVNSIKERMIYLMKTHENNMSRLIDTIVKQYGISTRYATSLYNDVKHMVVVSSNSLKSYDGIKVIPRRGTLIYLSQHDKVLSLRMFNCKSLKQIENITKTIYAITTIKTDKIVTSMSNVAKSFNKIIEYDSIEDETYTRQQFSTLHKSLKGRKGMSQYSRACQNTGDRIRQPLVYKDFTKLKDKGFKQIKDNVYERKVKGEEIHAIKQGESYYECDPSVHKYDHHIGFLSKSMTISGMCLPCCFKKSSITNPSIIKTDTFNSCIHGIKHTVKESDIYVGYILTDTLKLTTGKIAMLPKILDNIFNKNRTFKSSGGYLTNTKGYYFKYGPATTSLLESLSNVLQMDITPSILNKHLTESLFRFINNGSFYRSMKTLSNAKNYFTSLGNNVPIDIVFDMLSQPGITKFGINIYLFSKSMQNSSWNIICHNNELHGDDITRPFVVILEDGDVYIPIANTMSTGHRLSLTINTLFNNKDNSNLFNSVNNAYINTCKAKQYMYTSLTARSLSTMDIISQTIEDGRTIYVNTKKQCIPTIPSGIILNIPHAKPTIGTLDNTLLFFKSFPHPDYMPSSITFTDNKINGILLKNGLHVPCNTELLKDASKKQCDGPCPKTSLDEYNDKSQYKQYDGLNLIEYVVDININSDNVFEKLIKNEQDKVDKNHDFKYTFSTYIMKNYDVITYLESINDSNRDEFKKWMYFICNKVLFDEFDKLRPNIKYSTKYPKMSLTSLNIDNNTLIDYINHITEDIINKGIRYSEIIGEMPLSTLKIKDNKNELLINWRNPYESNRLLTMLNIPTRDYSTKERQIIKPNTYDEYIMQVVKDDNAIWRAIVNSIFMINSDTNLGYDNEKHDIFIPYFKHKVKLWSPSTYDDTDDSYIYKIIVEMTKYNVVIYDGMQTISELYSKDKIDKNIPFKIYDNAIMINKEHDATYVVYKK